MIPAETIKLKRSQQELSPAQIKEFIDGYVSGTVADYQMSAFLMATFFQGMTPKETWALTESMLHSGSVVDLSHIKGLKVDKHSTGGVGDKTSLIIGPLVAAAGVSVPMISGRGLGHTGGTLDKLESIPGFSTQLSLEAFKAQTQKLGLCFIGQTKEICPADKRMYALRDVTGTVECIPLICASIMSKKLAEGIDGLVLDVKVGSGAFMKNLKDARALAKGILGIARLAKKKITVLITDMNQPLGNAIGNALEVQECLDVMQGKGPADLRELSLELSAHMILLGRKAKNHKAARALAEEILQSGKAYSRFVEVVEAQGGKLSLPKAKNTYEILAAKNGFIVSLKTEAFGVAGLLLGAGRMKAEDPVDPSAGLILHKKIGSAVHKGEKLVTLYFNDGRALEEVKKIIHDAIEIRLQKKAAPRLIVERV